MFSGIITAKMKTEFAKPLCEFPYNNEIVHEIAP